MFKETLKQLKKFLKESTVEKLDISKSWIISKEEEKALKTVISLLEDCQ